MHKPTDKKVFMSDREKEIFLMSCKYTPNEVAKKLFLSTYTVKTHLSNIRIKNFQYFGYSNKKRCAIWKLILLKEALKNKVITIQEFLEE